MPMVSLGYSMNGKRKVYTKVGKLMKIINSEINCLQLS